MPGARSMRPNAMFDFLPHRTKVRVEHDCEECDNPILAGTTAIKVKVHTYHGYAPRWGFYHEACHEARYGALEKEVT